MSASDGSPQCASQIYFVGVDVGSGSARAALVTNNGHVIKTSVESIKTWNPKPDYYEQSSENIWNTCVKVIKVIRIETGIRKI